LRHGKAKNIVKSRERSITSGWSTGNCRAPTVLTVQPTGTNIPVKVAPLTLALPPIFTLPPQDKALFMLISPLTLSDKTFIFLRDVPMYPVENHLSLVLDGQQELIQ